MEFRKHLQLELVKIIPKDLLRAKSLIKAADDTLLAAKELKLKEYNYNRLI